MNSIGRVAAVPVLLGALAGCGSPGVYGDPATGWRDAVVVRIGSQTELASMADLDCNAAGASKAPYVVVRFNDGGLHSRSLGKPQDTPGVSLQVGDEVHVNIKDCSAPFVPMTARHGRLQSQTL